MLNLIEEIRSSKKGSLLIDFDENGYNYSFTIEDNDVVYNFGGFVHSLEEVAAAVREQVNIEYFEEYVKVFGLLGMGR